MATIVANYDGPLYIAVAKTFYNTESLSKLPFTLPVEYYAAHFPLYPLLIRGFSYILGYPYSMLFVTFITSILAIWFFSKYIADFVDKDEIIWMTILFSVFPARWLVVRSVGSPEPLFLFGVIGAIYFFRKEKYLLAGIMGAIATLTKSPGILLFPALFMAMMVSKFNKSAILKTSNILKSIKLSSLLPLFLIPLALIGVFYIYQTQFGSFLAYFKSGDNIHLFFPPFQIFNYSAPWVGTFWLEEVIFVYLLAAIGVYKLLEIDKVGSWFAGIFFISILFVAHRDLIRYSLPLIPFILAGFSKYLVKKEFKFAFAIIIIPIYLFSLAFISQNVMPIPDWAPLL